MTNDDNFAIETFGDSFRLMDFRAGRVLHEFPMVDRGKSEEFVFKNKFLRPYAREMTSVGKPGL